MSCWISLRRSGVPDSKRRVRFGLVFEARTAPQELASKFTRTPSMVMQL